MAKGKFLKGGGGVWASSVSLLRSSCRKVSAESGILSHSKPWVIAGGIATVPSGGWRPALGTWTGGALYSACLCPLCLAVLYAMILLQYDRAGRRKPARRIAAEFFSGRTTSPFIHPFSSPSLSSIRSSASRKYNPVHGTCAAVLTLVTRGSGRTEDAAGSRTVRLAPIVRRDRPGLIQPESHLKRRHLSSSVASGPPSARPPPRCMLSRRTIGPWPLERDAGIRELPSNAQGWEKERTLIP